MVVNLRLASGILDIVKIPTPASWYSLPWLVKNTITTTTWHEFLQFVGDTTSVLDPRFDKSIEDHTS